MPLSTQAKLLRVLEQGEYKPVGSNEIRKVDVRLVCATNRDLKKAVSEGTFREDLFYRINVMAIPLPALRERKEDIPGLAQHFLALAAERVGKKITGIDPAAMTALVAWSWPGNVREVLHIIERACVVTQTSTITCTDLPDELTGSMQSLGCYNTASIFGIPYNDAKELAISTFERLYLNDLLAKTKGSIAEAARIAGIDRSNFRRLLQRYEIDADSHRI
jgi:DNA-binding NtrC family response regulator